MAKDPQMREFSERLRRISRIHSHGGGFEAAGTLGQSYYTRQARRYGRPVLRPMLYMIGTVILAKSSLLASLGPVEYAARVLALQAGSGVEQAGAFVMGADPLTLAVAEALRPLLGS